MKNFQCFFSFKLICLFIYIFQLENFLVFSYVSITFYYENKNQKNSIIHFSSPRDYYEQMLNLSTYIDMKINDKIAKFHLTTERYASYISEIDYNETESQEISENKKQQIYSLDYIGITYANLQKIRFNFFVNSTIEQSINNYSLFLVKKMKKAREYEISRYCYATEKNEIGLKVAKGNKFDNVVVGDYEPYIDPDYKLIKNSAYNSNYNGNMRKLDTEYIITNGGYNVEDKTNLINQLKSNNLISSYAFTIKFDKNNELNGTLIIGGYPHEIDSKKYQEKYFIYDTIKVAYYYYYWHYEFRDIACGENIFSWVKEGEFSFEFPFILSTYSHRDYLDKQFFKNENHSKFCKEEKVGEYYVKYCSKEVIDKLQPFYFYLSKTYLMENQTDYIELNYNDLFIKSDFDDNIYLFQMIFVDNSYRWIFGKPFFKKYTIVFEQEKRIIGFYTKLNEYNDTNNNKEGGEGGNNENNENKSNALKDWFYLIVIFAVTFFIFSVILTVLVCKKIIFGKRKIKANELDEDYVYNTDVDKNDKNDTNQKDLLINE